MELPVERPIALVVGAASRDVTVADSRGWRLGGAVTHASLSLARLGIEVWALVGVDRLAARATELDLLRDAGVVLTLAELRSGPAFENIEAPAGRRQRCISTSDLVPLTALPRAWTSAFDALVLAPVAGELDDSWAVLGEPSPSATGGSARVPLVGLGWQGLLRTLEAGNDVERRAPMTRPLLTRADLVVVSADDLGPDVGPSEAVRLVRPGATLVITRAERGGSAFSRPDDGGRSALRAYSAIETTRVVDPTGAGDVFLAALVATALDSARLGTTGWKDRLLFAAAAASLSVEAAGLTGVPDLDAVRRRMTLAPSRASRRPSATSNRTSGRPSQA
jgi:sugar/nucleoside kinase (ribokinase family)